VLLQLSTSRAQLLPHVSCVVILIMYATGDILSNFALTFLLPPCCSCYVFHQVKEQAMRTNSVKANMARNDERISQLMRMVIKA
jgi:hypothetical protein